MDGEQKQQIPALLAEKRGGVASARLVYGEPVVVGEKTVLPVARVLWGFGGGGETVTGSDKSSAGGGGGIVAVPVGVVEITPRVSCWAHASRAGRAVKRRRRRPIIEAQSVETALLALINYHAATSKAARVVGPAPFSRERDSAHRHL